MLKLRNALDHTVHITFCVFYSTFTNLWCFTFLTTFCCCIVTFCYSVTYVVNILSVCICRHCCFCNCFCFCTLPTFSKLLQVRPRPPRPRDLWGLLKQVFCTIRAAAYTFSTCILIPAFILFFQFKLVLPFYSIKCMYVYTHTHTHTILSAVLQVNLGWPVAPW